MNKKNSYNLEVQIKNFYMKLNELIVIWTNISTL
jgi:hypothetical protein